MIYIRESFISGYAIVAVEKLSNIFSRKMKTQVLFSKTPLEYKNEYGSFAGYYFNCPQVKKRFRINFLLTKSDAIYSVDFYDSNRMRMTPAWTVDTAGMNVIQIVDLIYDELMNFSIPNFEESTIQERGYIPSDRSTQLFDAWVNDKKADALEVLTTKKMEDAYKTYLKAYKDNGEVPLYKFVVLAKVYIFSKGLTNPTFRKRKKGSSERVIDDQAKSDELEELIDSMNWEKKFNMITKSVDAVTKGQIQALIIFGSPGSGKTEQVHSDLKKFGVEALYLSGGLKSADELFNILKKHNKEEIIVFDDFDSALKNREMVDIFKAALQNKPEREIAWRDKILTFSSGVIFISNMINFDSALLSRAIPLKIDLSNEQMIDKINKTMKNFHPEVSIEIKKRAIEFLQEISRGVREVDYRSFEKIIIAQQTDPKDWKDWALLMMKSGN